MHVVEVMKLLLYLHDEEGNAITTTQQNITMQSITIQVHTTHKVLDTQWFGNFMFTLKYTDTEQARVSQVYWCC